MLWLETYEQKGGHLGENFSEGSRGTAPKRREGTVDHEMSATRLGWGSGRPGPTRSPFAFLSIPEQEIGFKWLITKAF